MAETKRTGGGHGRNHGYQRPKDMKGTFKKLMGYVGKYKGSLVLVAICLLISSAASVATSYLLKPLLNDYIIPGDFPGLFKMLLVMGGMYLLSSLCSFAYARIMVHVAQHTVAALRLDAVLGAAWDLSRGKAAELVASGRVQVDYLPELRPDRHLHEGAVLSVRGLGRAKIAEIGGKTKKDRVGVMLLRF